MTQKIKALGVTIVAVFIMSAIGAQAASADDFESAASTTILTASGSNHKFEVTGSAVTCNSVKLNGHWDSETETEVTILPEYTDCTAFGFIGAVFTGFGHLASEEGDPTCDFVLHAAGAVDLECGEGAEVTFDAGPCTVHIPEQTGLGTVSFKNVANGDVEVTLNVTKINLSHTDTFFCIPFSGSGSGKIGVLSGTSLVQGKSAGGSPINIAWNGTG